MPGGMKESCLGGITFGFLEDAVHTPLFPLLATFVQGILDGADLQLQLYGTGFVREGCCGKLLFELFEVPQLFDAGLLSEIGAAYRLGVCG